MFAYPSCFFVCLFAWCLTANQHKKPLIMHLYSPDTGTNKKNYNLQEERSCNKTLQIFGETTFGISHTGLEASLDEGYNVAGTGAEKSYKDDRGM